MVVTACLIVEEALHPALLPLHPVDQHRAVPALQVTTGWVITEVGVCQMVGLLEEAHLRLPLAQPRLLPRNQLLHQLHQNPLRLLLHRRQNLLLHHLLHLQSHHPHSSLEKLSSPSKSSFSGLLRRNETGKN